jgi:hypothetical protein
LVSIEFEKPSRPQSLFIRFRHPDAKPIRSVSVDGHDWPDFDNAKEWVRIKGPSHDKYSVVANY